MEKLIKFKGKVMLKLIKKRKMRNETLMRKIF